MLEIFEYQKKLVTNWIVINGKIPLMSNAKWRKLFIGLYESTDNWGEISINGFIKLVGNDEIDSCISDKVDDFNLRLTNIESFGGVWLYSCIECIRIPIQYKSDENIIIQQDLNRIENIISGIGKFALIKRSDELILNGYA